MSCLNIIHETFEHNFIHGLGCYTFLDHIVDRKDNKKKKIEEVSQMCEFPDVFPEDLPGLPPVHQVEFRIDLVPRATLIAKSPIIDWHPQRCKSSISNYKSYLTKVSSYQAFRLG